MYLPISMNAYKILNMNENINTNEYMILNLDEVSLVEKNELEEFKLIKINLKEKMPAVFFTNIIYYNNKNGTLPMGMNISKKILIDGSKYKFTLKTNKTV